MSSTPTFVCRHCRIRGKVNPRLKGDQHYCGKRCCQQARKNSWERMKLKSDPSYRSRRKTSKKAWYCRYPGDRYQSGYREAHPGYVSACREKQRLRNRERVVNASAEKIVKTDALNSENLTCGGLYMLSPYNEGKRGKIVKTDALIVEIRHGIDFQRFFQSRSP